MDSSDRSSHFPCPLFPSDMSSENLSPCSYIYYNSMMVSHAMPSEAYTDWNISGLPDVFHNIMYCRWLDLYSLQSCTEKCYFLGGRGVGLMDNSFTKFSQSGEPWLIFASKDFGGCSSDIQSWPVSNSPAFTCRLLQNGITWICYIFFKLTNYGF